MIPRTAQAHQGSRDTRSSKSSAVLLRARRVIFLSCFAGFLSHKPRHNLCC